MSVDSTKAKCPGQDTMFWKPEDIYDVECGKCGAWLEFFKDEVSRRCRKCGTKVMNPKFNLGCAQWCEHAKDCLGYDPKEQKAEAPAPGGGSLADSLISAMKREFGDDQKRITHALTVLEYAEKIMKDEGAEPRVVVPAAILHDIGIREAERKHNSNAPKFQELEGPPIAGRILKEIGVDSATISSVLEIIANHHSANCPDSPEFRSVWDADQLVNLAEEAPGLDRDVISKKIEKVFRTGSGRKKAVELLLK